MASGYEPSEHIQPLATAPRDESVLDQREVTVQSYQSTVPFNLEVLEAGLESAWLSPTNRLGIFSRLSVRSDTSATVVLGLQDELSVRTYDYDKRRPLWYSWQNVIVDTVSMRYCRDDHGLLRFTATGGGRRITDDLLHDFNTNFLGIPKASVTKQHFDLAKLRSLCFTQFVDRLYMLRFADPSGEEYRSIDHALFQSRQYIDPEAERLKEIQADPKVIIESFDSDVEVQSSNLAAKLRVRFFLRGLSGSLRLRFPKIRYKKEPRTPDEHAQVFYRLVDTAVTAIIDADYYTHQPRTLDELDLDHGMFIDMVDLAPFREVMANPDSRTEFLQTADFGDGWQHWQPHLRSLDELVEADPVSYHCSELFRQLAAAAPARVADVLRACREDTKLKRLGGVLAAACRDALQSVPAAHRAAVESELAAWALAQPDDVWHVDVEAGAIKIGRLCVRLDELCLDTIVAVLGRLLTALHAGLMGADGDIRSHLEQMRWCVEAASALPANHHRLSPALRLIASGLVPRLPNESARVLRDPAESFEDLDHALLDQFGLPAWPSLRASTSDNGVVVSNDGVGAAPGLAVRQCGSLFEEGDADLSDVAAGSTVTVAFNGQPREAEIQFKKFGSERRLSLRLDHYGIAPSSPIAATSPVLPINRKRIEAQRNHRQQIDPSGLVIGSSRSLLRVFEEIHHSNMMDDAAAVLILGEPGVGKTHIAKLIHGSSERSSAALLEVNAGGAGGDLNIQRGEWIGYGRGHGISGVDPKGRPGYLIRADGGTLFVDEFAALSPDLQVIFLSVLEQRSIELIGGDSITPNVRCVFATNANVDEAVTTGALRRDLLDRISTTIQIPPLRDRRGDILLLARHFAGATAIDERCQVALIRHDWPGNIRELQKILSLAVVRAQSDDSGRLSVEHCDLPNSVVKEVAGLADDECRRELWHLADSIARVEGYEPGTGLQRRAAEIMGVKEAQASKMYCALGLKESISA